VTAHSFQVEKKAEGKNLQGNELVGHVVVGSTRGLERRNRWKEEPKKDHSRSRVFHEKNWEETDVREWR